MDNTKLGVIFLGIIGILCVAGAIVLAADSKELPEFVVATGGAAVAAIAGLLGGAGLGRAAVIKEINDLDAP